MPDPTQPFDIGDPTPAPDTPPVVTPPEPVPPVTPPAPGEPPEGEPPEPKPPEPEPPEGAPEGDPEMYDSDEEYLKEQGFYERGMPGHIKTIEDVLAYGQSMATQAMRSSGDAQKLSAVNDALARSGYQGGVEALIAGGGLGTQAPAPTMQPQQPTGQSFVPNAPYSDAMEQQLKTNPAIKPEEAAWLRQQAAAQDRAYQSYSNPIVSALGGIVQEVAELKRGHKNSEYRFLSKKMREAVPRFELDAIINNGRAKTYEEAIIEYARTVDPNLFLQLYGKGDQPPGTPPKTRRSPGIRVRQKSIQKDPMVPYQKYLTPTGEIDDAKLPKDMKEQVKILEAIQRLTKPT